MWKVIYIAPNAHVAKRLKDLLVAEGLLVRERPLNSNNCKGPVELLVPKLEAAEAHELLNRALCSQEMNEWSRV